MMKREEVRSARHAIILEIHVEDERHKRKIARLNAKMAEMRTKCQHKKCTYHGDPAGGSDSYHECDDCGKYL